MTDFFWPSTLIPARSTVTLRDLSSRFVSPFTGTARTYSRPGGELFSMRLDLPPLTTDKAAALRGMLAKLRGGVHRVWCRDHSYRRRGSFPSTELLANNTFANGATGWTPNLATLTAADSVLRLAADTHTVAQYPTAAQDVTLVSGVAYAFRSFYQNVTGSAAFGPFFDYGSTSTSSYSTSSGLKTLSAVADGTTGQAVLVWEDESLAGDVFEVPYTSVARCALVKGSSQTGARLLIDALPVSTNGLLLEGDQVQIGEELLTVAAPLNANSSGEGYLTLHRPLRSAPSDNAPVIIHEPMGLFMLAENENGWDNVPGRITNASVTLIEAPR